MTTAEFAREVQDCSWIYDLFACGFDFISSRLDTPRTENDHKGFADAEDDAYQHLHRSIIRADGSIPTDVWHYLDVPGQDALLNHKGFLVRLATVLRVIDRVSLGLNYLANFQDRNEWMNVEREMKKNEMRLSRGGRRVVLKPRPRFPLDDASWWRRGLADGTLEEPPARGEHWSRMFSNLCRVPDIPGCELVHRILPQRLELSDADWSRLRIGMVPLIEDLQVVGSGARLTPGPLQFITDSDNHLIVEPANIDWDQLCANAVNAVRFLAERQVQIVLFPEAVVSNEVVGSIKQELQRLSASGSTYPVLVLAGTFERWEALPSRPGYNQAIVLNGRGDELWRQSKLHPYSMKGYEQRRYGLEPIFGGKDADEHITTHPREIVFYDSRSTGIRMVVAICEDSAQEDPCLVAIRRMQPNLVLIPVMAGALCAERGFARTVAGLTMDPGCLSAVVNSGALPRAEWRNGNRSGAPPLGIVGLPLMNHANGHISYAFLDSVLQVTNGGPEVLVFECP